MLDRLTNYILFFTFCIAGCTPLLKNDRGKYITSIPQTPKTLDIPKYANGYPFTYWHFCKQKEKQLGLESPERTIDSLRYRVWITNPIGTKNQSHGLIEIKYDSSKWTGRLILMRVDLDARHLSETINKFDTWNLTPKTSWNSIIDSLIKLKIDSLPTDEKIQNYYTEDTRYNNNEATYSFEYSTRSNYRFYQYNNIYRVPDKFWQAKNVVLVGNLLEREFKWDSIARKYFKLNY